MKRKIIIFITLLILVYGCGSYWFTGLQSQVREDFEEGNFCDSRQKLRWTYLVSKEGKYLFAAILARGLCGEQDIPRAKELYTSANGNDASELGKTLFYDAIETAESANRNEIELNPTIIKALFAESKSLGFSPDGKDISEIQKTTYNRSLWIPRKWKNLILNNIGGWR